MKFASVVVFLALAHSSITEARSLVFDKDDEEYGLLKSKPKAQPSNRALSRASQPGIYLNSDDLLNLIVMAILAIPQSPKLPADVYKLILNPFRLNAALDVKGRPVLSKGQIDIPIAAGARVGAFGYVGGIAVGLKPSIGVNGLKMSVGTVAGFGSKFGSNGEVANGDTPSIHSKKK